MAQSTKKAVLVKAESKPVVAITVAAVLLALGLVATDYFVRSLNFHRQVFSKKGQVVSQLEANAKTLTSLESDFENLERVGPTSDEVLAALPTSKDFPQAASTIENIVKRSGAEVKSVRLSTSDVADPSQENYAAANPELQKMLIDIEVTGSYSAFRTLLDNLEKSRRVFRVESVDLNGTNSRVNATMSLTTFYKPAVDNSIEQEVFKL